MIIMALDHTRDFFIKMPGLETRWTWLLPRRCYFSPVDYAFLCAGVRVFGRAHQRGSKPAKKQKRR
jgi:hypothetical protein